MGGNDRIVLDEIFSAGRNDWLQNGGSVRSVERNKPVHGSRVGSILSSDVDNSYDFVLTGLHFFDPADGPLQPHSLQPRERNRLSSEADD